MATACETFYDQDYLDLNPDVAKHATFGKDPRKHWNDYGRKEIKDGVFTRKFNKQCTTPVRVAPTVFLTGASTAAPITPPVIPPIEPPVTPDSKIVTKIIIHYTDGTTQEVDVKTKMTLYFG